MKIFIMTDLEGCAGVMNLKDYCYAESRYYEEARALLSHEVSAAVEGALQAGATEVVVADAHGAGGINRMLLHPRAKLLGGRPGAPEMAHWGVDGSFAAAFIIGQHAMSNTDGGHLSHSFSLSVDSYALNGMPIGELGMIALGLGYFGVPLVLVTGDQAACDEARALVNNIEAAPVKWGVRRGSATGLTADQNREFNCMATHLHPDEARGLIRERAYRAVKRIPEIMPCRFDGPYTLNIVYRKGGAEVSNGGKVAVKAGDFLDLLRRHGDIRNRIPKADYDRLMKSQGATPAKPAAKKPSPAAVKLATPKKPMPPKPAPKKATAAKPALKKPVAPKPASKKPAANKKAKSKRK